MSRKNTEEEHIIAVFKSRERAKIQKLKIKERVRVSNENVKNGLPVDPWVIEYRFKNNKTKSNWILKQPAKEKKVRVANSGCFKKGDIPKTKLSPENKLKSIIKGRERSNIWQRNNKEKVNEWARKRRENPDIKIKCNLRKRLSFLLRKNIISKTEQTFDLLGISIQDFMKYLESKFQEGMTFENYGQWHLDHIKPCYYFDLTKLEDREKCFHFSNIQPMWAVDNLRKNKNLHYEKTGRP